MENINIPQYMENIDFDKNYKPFTMEQKEKCVNQIKEYREAKLKKRLNKAEFIKTCIDTMLEEKGIIDYAQLTIKWKEYQNKMCKLENSDIVINYYELLHDMATNPTYEKLIEVQAGSGKLKPAHRKVDENLKVIVKYEADMFQVEL